MVPKGETSEHISQTWSMVNMITYNSLVIAALCIFVFLVMMSSCADVWLTPIAERVERFFKKPRKTEKSIP